MTDPGLHTETIETITADQTPTTPAVEVVVEDHERTSIEINLQLQNGVDVPKVLAVVVLLEALLDDVTERGRDRDRDRHTDEGIHIAPELTRRTDKIGNAAELILALVLPGDDNAPFSSAAATDTLPPEVLHHDDAEPHPLVRLDPAVPPVPAPAPLQSLDPDLDPHLNHVHVHDLETDPCLTLALALTRPPLTVAAAAAAAATVKVEAPGVARKMNVGGNQAAVAAAGLHRGKAEGVDRKVAILDQNPRPTVGATAPQSALEPPLRLAASQSTYSPKRNWRTVNQDRALTFNLKEKGDIQDHPKLIKSEERSLTFNLKDKGNIKDHLKLIKSEERLLTVNLKEEGDIQDHPKMIKSEK